MIKHPVIRGLQKPDLCWALCAAITRDACLLSATAGSAFPFAGSDNRPLTHLLIFGSARPPSNVHGWGNDWPDIKALDNLAFIYHPLNPTPSPAFFSTARHRKGLYSHIFSRIKIEAYSKRSPSLQLFKISVSSPDSASWALRPVECLPWKVSVIPCPSASQTCIRTD